jgi:glucokinase
MKQKIICFDVGGTNISKAVVEIEKQSKKFDFLEFETVKNPIETSLVRNIFRDYSKRQKEKYQTSLVAISTARPVQKEKLLVHGAEDYYGKEFFDFNFLKENGFEVGVENDGKSFALGEYNFGKGSEAQSLLTLVIGTGIGCGFVDSDGNILNGKKGFATEVDHQQIYFDGKWERWGKFCSGGGIEEKYRQRTGISKSAQEIFDNLESDKEAQLVVNQATDVLGIGIANLLTVFDPSKVIVGGGMVNHVDFIKNAFEIAQKNLFFKKYVSYDWELTELNRRANLLGASFDLISH